MKEPEQNFSPESIDQMTERFFNELPEQDRRLVADLYQTYTPCREENSRSLQRIWSRFAQAQKQYLPLQEGQREAGSETLRKEDARTPATRPDAPVPGSFQRPPQPLARRSRRSFWWRFSSVASAAVILLAILSLLLLTRTSFVGNPQTALGASLPLNEGPQLSQNIVFQVKSSEGGQYLAEISFDTYNGHTWNNSALSSSSLPANKRMVSESPSAHLVTQQITVVNSPGELQPYILGAGQIASANQATTVLNNKKTGSQIAVLLNNGKSLAAGEQLTVQSYVSSASATQLISATTYSHSTLPQPDHKSDNSAIYQAYLQLPSNLDPGILAKAQQITAGAKSLYEIAADLEEYLRSNYIYNTNIILPPGQESVSWFLFHSRNQGFCNYFATAMAIMARELGMPARVVTGYTSGVYDATTQTWVVRGSDAHAWTQIYFDGYGWISFEPSPTFPVFVRPL